MKHLLLLTTAAFLGSVGVAAAADPVGRAALPVFSPPAFTWTGFYVGAHAGYLWSDSDMKLVDVRGDVLPIDVRNETLPRRVSIDMDGPLGGMQAGYNMQFGQFVVGLEGDVSLVDADAEGRFSAPDRFMFNGTPFQGAITNTVARSELEAFGTVRGRFGMTVDRALVFVTVGAAAADIKNSYSISIPTSPLPPGGYFSPTWSKSGTEWGWTVGAGVEYAVTNNITVKAEYLYYDLDDHKVRGTDTSLAVFANESIVYKFKNDGSVARGGVNFKF
jgi:outer membrane immunogenic protein